MGLDIPAPRIGETLPGHGNERDNPTHWSNAADKPIKTEPMALSLPLIQAVRKAILSNTAFSATVEIDHFRIVSNNYLRSDRQ
jgi:hypothetical protein